MLEAEDIKSEAGSELLQELAIVRISALQDIVVDLEQQVEAKTHREEALQNRLNELEAIINLQSQIQQKLEREMREENILLKERIGQLVKDFEEKSKTVIILKEQLKQERCVSRISEMYFEKKRGPGYQVNNQTDDSGSSALDMEINLFHSVKEWAKCHQREMLYAKCIEAQQSETIELLRKLTTAKKEEERLKKVITDMETNLQGYVNQVFILTKKLEKERLYRKGKVSSTAELIKGLDYSMQKILSEKEVLCKKLSQSQNESNKLLKRVEILESQISQETKTITTPREMSVEMVKSLQQLHKLFLQHREHRKALAFQKRYLLYTAGLHQLMENRTLISRMNAISNVINSPRLRFRCTALAITSIYRMKWLINRWQTDSRTSADTVIKKFEKSVNEISSNLNVYTSNRILN